MTKVMIPSFGWLYLVVVLGWYTKKIVGCLRGIQSKTTDWLDALHCAVNKQFSDGIREQSQKKQLRGVATSAVLIVDCKFILCSFSDLIGFIFGKHDYRWMYIKCRSKLNGTLFTDIYFIVLQ